MKKITSKIAVLALVSVFVLGYGVYIANAQSVTATSVTCNSTILQGDVSINPSGTPTNIWFQWGKSSVLENNSNQQTSTYSSVFSQPIYNLSPSTTYYYRAVAQNAPFGTVYGSIYNFSTPSCGNQSPPVNYNTNVTQTASVIKYNTTVSNKLVRTRVVSSQESLINLSMTSDNERACSGETIGFTVEYENVSNQTLKDVVLRVSIPGEFNFDGSSSGAFSEKDNILIVDIGTLSPDEKGKVTARVSVSRTFSENETLVTTSNLVYATNDGVQEEVIAYSLSKFGCYSSNGAAAFFSGSFFPTTLFGWLILILIISILVLLSRRAYGSYTVSKK